MLLDETPACPAVTTFGLRRSCVPANSHPRLHKEGIALRTAQQLFVRWCVVMADGSCPLLGVPVAGIDAGVPSREGCQTGEPCECANGIHRPSIEPALRAESRAFRVVDRPAMQPDGAGPARYNSRVVGPVSSRVVPFVTHAVTHGRPGRQRSRNGANSGEFFDAEGWPSGRWRWS